MSGRQTGVTVDHLPGRLSSGPPDSANSHAAVAGLPETGPRGLPCELASHASVAGHPETGPQRLQRDALSTRAAVAGLPRSGPQRLQRRFHTQPLRDSRRSARSGCNVSRAWGGGEDTRPPARSNFLQVISKRSVSRLPEYRSGIQRVSQCRFRHSVIAVCLLAWKYLASFGITCLVLVSRTASDVDGG